MAINTVETTTTSNQSFTKADRFINISVPTKDGSQVRLGSLALRESDPNQAKLIEWLDKNTDKNIKTLMGSVEVTYRSSEKVLF